MITLDTRDFDADIRRFAEQLELGPGIVARKIALDIFGDLLAGTPVDTGRARSNWRISIRTPDLTVLETVGESAASAAIQYSIAQARLFRFNGRQPIYITNPLPYIEPLNEGWSQQAPAGFVQAAILRNVRPVITAREFLGRGQ